MWQPFFVSITTTVIVLFAWSLAGEAISRLPGTRQRAVLGLAMALAAVGSMAMAMQIAPGVYYDIRAPIIAVAALFGGIPAVLIAGGATLVYRLYLGGAVGSGSLLILVAALIGMIAHTRRRRETVELRDIALLLVLSPLPSLGAIFTLPASKQAAFFQAGATPFVIAVAATAILAGVLWREERSRALAVSNRLYRSMVDALPDALNIKDADGVFLAANPATAALMRAGSADNLIGKSDFDFYPEAMAKAFRQDELATLAGSQHNTIEQPAQWLDGSSGWLFTLKVPLVDAAGNFVGLITHNRDITAQKILQTKLAETQSYLDQALEHMNDGLAMYDPNGAILFCNSRYRGLFPKTAHLRVPGANFRDIILGSVLTGEEPVPRGKSFDQHLAGKLAGLRTDSVAILEMAGGRVFEATTQILSNGCSLRMISDITARRSFEKHLEYQALHDPLTSLPNRAFFNRDLDRRITEIKANGGELVLMLLDLDRFKEVNDTFGHAVGDKLLVEVALRLRASVRSSDVAVRLGGDEFAILASNLQGEVDADGLAARVMRVLTKPLKFEDIVLLPGGTLGYTIFPADPSDADGLLRNADLALYRAKSSGRGTWKAFDPMIDVSRKGFQGARRVRRK